MAILQSCGDCTNEKIHPVGRICDTHNSKLNTVAITACGKSFNNCLTDSYAAWDCCSVDAVYPATYPNGEAHPLAGQPNPLAKTIAVFQQVKGDIYAEPTVEETELDVSCGPAKVFGKATFVVTIDRLYTLEDEPLFCQLNDQEFGEIAFVDQNGLGYIASNPSIKAFKKAEDDQLYSTIEVTFQKSNAYLKGLPTAAPYFLDCDS